MLDIWKRQYINSRRLLKPGLVQHDRDAQTLQTALNPTISKSLDMIIALCGNINLALVRVHKVEKCLSCH
jgi:hypothetical protein